MAASASRQQTASSSSQLRVSAGDDDKVVLTGSGLQTARVNEHAEFTIDGTNAGYGQSPHCYKPNSVTLSWCKEGTVRHCQSEEASILWSHLSLIHI